MLPGFLLALREGVEAALVIGILFGALRRLNVSQLSASVWWGVFSAFIVSLLVAAGLTLAGAELEGPAEPVFEGLTMLFAAGLLTWMIFWMHGQSRNLRSQIEENIREALARNGGMADSSSTGGSGAASNGTASSGTASIGTANSGAVNSGAVNSSIVNSVAGNLAHKRALFGVAFLAVVREGIELALFLVAAGMAVKSDASLLGALLGLLAAFALGWVMFSSTRRLPLGRFFRVTNILLILFAAGLASRAVHEFNEVGWIPAVIAPFYNLNPLFSDSSSIGQVLKTLFGYNSAPSLTESFAYLTYFVVLVLSLFRIQRIAGLPIHVGQRALFK